MAGAIKSNTKFLFQHTRARSLPGSPWDPRTARVSAQTGQGYCRKVELILAPQLAVEETEDVSSLEAFLSGLNGIQPRVPRKLKEVIAEQGYVISHVNFLGTMDAEG